MTNSNFELKLTESQYAVLKVLATNTDEEGASFYSNTELADVSGVSVRTVISAVQKLMGIDVGGSMLLIREEIEGVKGFAYTVDAEVSKQLFSSQESTTEDEEADAGEAVTISNAGDLMLYFCDKFKQVYGTSYPLNKVRETRPAQKLIDLYSSEDLVLMIDTTIEEYTNRWKKQEYPLPTISGMSSWIGSVALAIAKDKSNELLSSKEVARQADITNREALLHFGIHPVTLEQLAGYNGNRETVAQLYEDASNYQAV